MSKYHLKGMTADVSGHKYAFDDELLLGRGTDCHVRIEDQDVADRHAHVRVSEGGIVIRGLDDAHPVWVNGEQVRERSLVSGDEIRVGRYRFMLQAPGVRPESVLRQPARKPAARLWPWLAGVAALAASAAAAWYWLH